MYLKIETKYRYPLIHTQLGCDLRTKNKRKKIYNIIQQYKESKKENDKIHSSILPPTNVLQQLFQTGSTQLPNVLVLHFLYQFHILHIQPSIKNIVHDVLLPSFQSGSLQNLLINLLGFKFQLSSCRKPICLHTPPPSSKTLVMLKCFGIRSEEVLNYISKYNLLTDGPEKHKKDTNVLSFTPSVSIQVQ